MHPDLLLGVHWTAKIPLIACKKSISISNDIYEPFDPQNKLARKCNTAKAVWRRNWCVKKQEIKKLGVSPFPTGN